MNQLLPVWILVLLMASATSVELKEDPADAIFTADRVAGGVQSKRTRVPTRWPLMDTWVTDHRSRVASPQGKSESEANSHSPLAQNIKCLSKGQAESFTAVLSQPFGFHNVPLFEDAVDTPNPLASEDCQMKRSEASGTFLMKINDFSKCGVTTQKGQDGKEWLSVSIVFPYVGNLRTSDDEHVMIMCKPQDRMVTKSHVIDYRPNMPSSKKAIYSSPNQEMDTKIIIFTRKGSSTSFTEELSRNALIQVGQDLQLRAIVRPGDGWRYAKLRDLTIQRSSDDDKGRGKSDKTSASDKAYLVMEDGCRNPVFAAIAPKHPTVDTGNPLVVNFIFKAFMFQNMADGDTLRISAKIVACQELSDCQPTVCVDDDLSGNGRRKRSLPHLTLNNEKDNSSNCIHNWTRDYELSVVMPGFSKSRIESSDLHLWRDSMRILHSQDNRCKNVIFATALISMILMIATAMIAIATLRSKDAKVVKYTASESLPSSASVGSFSPENGNRRNATTPILLASSFLKSSVRGLGTRIHNSAI